MVWKWGVWVGRGCWFRIVSPFPRKSRIPHYFIAFPNPFFFENTRVKKVWLLQKRISVRCRLTLSIYVLNYTLVWWSGGKTREEEAKRGGEGFFPLSFPALIMTPFLWSFERLEPSPVTARIEEWPKLWLSDSREQSWDHCTVRHILSFN